MTDALILWLLIAAAVPVNLYPAVYAFRPWRSTPQGRALMTKALGNMLIIDVILARHVFGDYPYRAQIVVAVFALFVLGIYYLTVTLLTSPGADRYPPLSWVHRRRERV